MSATAVPKTKQTVKVECTLPDFGVSFEKLQKVVILVKKGEKFKSLGEVALQGSAKFESEIKEKYLNRPLRLKVSFKASKTIPIAFPPEMPLPPPDILTTSFQGIQINQTAFPLIWSKGFYSRLEQEEVTFKINGKFAQSGSKCFHTQGNGTFSHSISQIKSSKLDNLLKLIDSINKKGVVQLMINSEKPYGTATFP